MIRKALDGGWPRIAVVVAACVGSALLLFGGEHNIFQAMMRWLEFISPMPGLSGLALLFLVPVFFLIANLAVSWIVLGFKGNPS